MSRFSVGKRFTQAARVSSIVVALAVFGSGSAQAAFVSYDTQASWDAAVAALGLGVSVEDFSDPALAAGLTTTNASVGSGVLSGLANTQFNDAGNPRLNFSPGTRAVGGFWDLALGGGGDGLLFIVNGTNLVGSIAGSVDNPFAGFRGWVSNDATTIASLRIDSSFTGTENFTVDNVRFAAGSAGPGEEEPGGGNTGGGTAVPEPSLVILVGFGIAGVVARKFRG